MSQQESNAEANRKDVVEQQEEDPLDTQYEGVKFGELARMIKDLHHGKAEREATPEEVVEAVHRHDEKIRGQLIDAIYTLDVRMDELEEAAKEGGRVKQKFGKYAPGLQELYDVRDALRRLTLYRTGMHNAIEEESANEGSVSAYDEDRLRESVIELRKAAQEADRLSSSRAWEWDYYTTFKFLWPVHMPYTVLPENTKKVRKLIQRARESANRDVRKNQETAES